MTNEEEIYSLESLSKDMENDFLKKTPLVLSFRGGNGVWTAKIAGNYHYFKTVVEDYCKTRVYMHLKNIELINNASGTVLIELL